MAQPTPQLSLVLQRLQLPVGAAPEQLLGRLAHVHKQVRLRRTANAELRAQQGRISPAPTRLHTNQLLQQLQEEEDSARGTLPLAQLAEKRLVAPLPQRQAAVAAAVTDWWEQPAQLAVPWVKVDGGNAAQWLQEWRHLTHELQAPAAGHDIGSVAIANRASDIIFWEQTIGQ